MNDVVQHIAENEQDWFIENAGRHPLLTSEEEKQIDEEKWGARTTLLTLFVRDTYCRRFLQQWAEQLPGNAPRSADVTDRQAYLALRREQTPLLKVKGGRKTLQSLSTILSEKNYSKHMQMQADALLDNLNIPAVLAVAMAEYLLQEVDCSEAAEGIRHWASSWPAVDQHEAGSISNQYAPALQQALNSYKRARDTLVNHNLRLVFSVAGKLQSPHVSFMDRVQNGVFGLIRAAEKFESSKGFRFSTYAFSWINQAIQRGLQDQRGIVRYPSDVSESISKMYRERSEFLHKYGREPGELELASLLNTKPESLFQLRQVTDIAVSFDSPLGDASNGTTLEDKLSGETFASPSALVEQESLNKSLRRCLKVLSEQEQIVVDMRWGLGESRPLSRKELSAHLSISQERIRQIEEKALEKLRHDQNMIAEYRIQRSMD